MHSDQFREYDKTRRDFNILIIDDDSKVVKIITKILKDSNPRYYIESASCVESALGLIKKTYWDTILLDLSLPLSQGEKPDPHNGLRTLERLKNDLKIDAPVIAITGQDDEELSETVLDIGAYYFLTKPLRNKSLSAIVRNATTFQMTGFDGLTGLLNKSTFIERLKSEFERVRRKNQEVDSIVRECNDDMNISCISLLFLDGDNFKYINDTYSHLVGDQVLKKISGSFIDENLYKVLENNFESVKYIIRPYDIAARFGGDEFSIFLPETNHRSALVVARRIRDVIKKIKLADIVGEENIDNDVKDITLSIGIATYPSPNMAMTHEELIVQADTAMYASKETRTGDIYGYNAEGMLIKMD